MIEAILLCGALAGAVSAYIGTGSSDGPLTKVMLTGFAVVLLIYTIGSVVVGRHIERYSKKIVNIFFKDAK